jgi:hypothetical protein
MFSRIVWMRALGTVIRVPYRAVLTPQGRVLFERADNHDAMGSLRWTPCPMPDEYLTDSAEMMGSCTEEDIASVLPPLPAPKEEEKDRRLVWKPHRRSIARRLLHHLGVL